MRAAGPVSPAPPAPAGPAGPLAVQSSASFGPLPQAATGPGGRGPRALVPDPPFKARSRCFAGMTNSSAECCAARQGAKRPLRVSAQMEPNQRRKETIPTPARSQNLTPDGT
ncbi:MAG: hypothetical protein BroJett031_04080 [Betaproteobacteria bacterium]|nr:MAG: hypothetical protein BroJett031_04080 [Betaproteobacteria bacterium]